MSKKYVREENIIESLEQKICRKCKINKPFKDFHNQKAKQDGKTNFCRQCTKQYSQIYYVNNKEKILISHSIWQKKNQKNLNIYNKEWKLKNKEQSLLYHRKWQKIRRSNNIKFRLAQNLRNGLNKVLKRKKLKKHNSTLKYLGCSREFLIEHLKSKFQPGMSWKNYGKWQIDHIIPLNSAQNVEDLIKLCHYTNLQPLWEFDNISKGDKIIVCQEKCIGKKK